MWASGFQAPKPQPEEGGPGYLLPECWGRFSFRCRQVCCALKETASANAPAGPFLEEAR